MTLQWTARFFINVDDFSIGIAWQVNIISDFYLCHFFVDLGLRCSVSTSHIYRSYSAYLFLCFGFLDVGFQLSGYRRDLAEESELAVIGVLFRTG